MKEGQALERDPLVRWLLLMLAAIGTVWLAGWVWQLASRFSDVILLFFLAWLLAFTLSPVARGLQRLGLPRLLAVGAVYAGLFILLTLTGLLVIPAAVAQLIQLAGSLPALAADLQARADQLHLTLIERGLPEAQLSDFYRNVIARAEALGTALLANSLAIATTILSSLLNGMIILVLSFYIMLDGDKIAAVFLDLLPKRYREDAAAALDHIDRTFGGFVRGQLIQAAVYTLGTAIVMELAQLPYALILSAFAGIAMLIPIVGPYLAMTPPVILAIILAPGTLWWVILLLLVLQFVVVNVLAPKIMSQSVGIHPLLVFAALFIGAKLAGVWGAIFGVPVAAMLSLLARVFYQRVVLRMPLYRRGAPLSPEAFVPSPAPPPAAAPPPGPWPDSQPREGPPAAAPGTPAGPRGVPTDDRPRHATGQPASASADEPLVTDRV
jgi:predicted PurR-regulated permease PerM